MIPAPPLPSWSPTGARAGIGPRAGPEGDDTASKKRNGNAKKAQEAEKPPRRKIGEFALVLRVPKDAVAYIDERAGDRPRTAFARDLLCKADGTLGRILRGE